MESPAGPSILDSALKYEIFSWTFTDKNFGKIVVVEELKTEVRKFVQLSTNINVRCALPSMSRSSEICQ